jgi:hypothetical protein
MTWITGVATGRRTTPSWLVPRLARRGRFVKSTHELDGTALPFVVAGGKIVNPGWDDPRLGRCSA